MMCNTAPCRPCARPFAPANTRLFSPVACRATPAVPRSRAQNLLASVNERFKEVTRPDTTGKRHALLLLLSGVGALTGLRPSFADAPSQTYRDDRDGFTVDIPEGWVMSQADATQGTGPTATRRTLAWFEEGKPSTYVTATITNVGADYTSLGSFGTAEQFGSNLVASMDQSFLKKARFGKSRQNVQEARLLSARDSGTAFNIEYTVKRTDSDERHLLSVISLGYNGRFTRLYTVTAQAPETAFPEEKGTLQRILASFNAPEARKS